METNQSPRLTISEEEFLRQAAQFLESPGYLIKLINLIGMPLEKSLQKLPEKYAKLVSQATKAALSKGVEVVATTVRKEKSSSFVQAEEESRLSGYQHTALAFGLGAAGGLLGALSLPVELPLTTAVMLRSILNTANEFGLNVTDPQVQMECLYILTLGSPQSSSDDAMESAYWTSRMAFAGLIREAAAFMARFGAEMTASQLSRESAPVLVRFLAAVGSRFETVVTEKFVAEAVPVVGALGGGAINAAFTDYFSDAARFHFGLRNLEQKYGQGLVQEQYSRFKQH